LGCFIEAVCPTYFPPSLICCCGKTAWLRRATAIGLLARRAVLTGARRCLHTFRRTPSISATTASVEQQQGSGGSPLASSSTLPGQGSVLHLLERTHLPRAVAGLASNHCSWPVKGFLPKRRLVAGTLTDVTLNRPGKVNSPAPFLCRVATIVFSRCRSTALTALVSSSASHQAGLGERALERLEGRCCAGGLLCRCGLLRCGLCFGRHGLSGS